jgi:mono/diheme cytochrome c family protein
MIRAHTFRYLPGHLPQRMSLFYVFADITALWKIPLAKSPPRYYYCSNRNSIFLIMVKKALIILPLIAGPCWLLFAQNNSLSQSIKRGQEVFNATCILCHKENGQGQPGVYPPLANSDFLLKDTKRAIGIVVNGLDGEIIVNGKIYNLDMPAQKQLNDQQVTDVLNFVRNSWGNKGKAIAVTQIKAARK